MSASKETLHISYRAFTVTDIDAAHGLSIAVRWPHRAEDWRFALEAGAGFVAELDGVVIGTALFWAFGADRASLGMVIVSPDYQGHGIGRKLMELLLEQTAGRITFLHATPAGKPLYEKLGFEAFGWTQQHQGTISPPPLAALPDGERLRPLSAEDLPRVIELASRASGLDRSAVLPALLEVAQGIGLERDGELIGFSILRRFGRGHVIGPVVAAEPGDLSGVKALVHHWLAAMPDEFMRIDIPAECGLAEWLVALGMAHVDTPLKMVRNAPTAPQADTRVRQFAIVNQAMY
ncbi:GNAT family N-acetyltransferase [Paraburkholderia sp.]|uniref:GNAT family N-acetyltransferase n=1 Tax=Paraburkholderia sp. TaxID=1926495 RepID=UPI002397AA4E|nr:GNAT family N-acetyltransferase [Paraburkholderia sp.]MDE1180881.1 GNAT family N-acetyltransferase [Paraburkholderia sp.]